MSKKPKTANVNSNAFKLLESLNLTYLRIHKTYEKFFWQSYMGDHSIDDRFEKAQIARETFRSSSELADKVVVAKKSATKKEHTALEQWEWFFSKYQTPDKAKSVFKQIVSLEKDIFRNKLSVKKGILNQRQKIYYSTEGSDANHDGDTRR